MEKHKIKNHVTKDELIGICQFDHILQSFGIDETLVDETGCADWELLDDCASIAVKRRHVPTCPGLCCDMFYLFDCDPSTPLAIAKKSDGTFVDLTHDYFN